MAILVTGGAGYIGTHTCVALLQAGHEIVVADNLSNSCETAIHRVEQITGKTVTFEKVELCDVAQVDDLFKRHPEIESVIHFAGLKSVPESMDQPLHYYGTNLISTMTLVKVMKDYGVKKLVFSSSASVYGNEVSSPVAEDAPTHEAISPYAASKAMLERILWDVSQAEKDIQVIVLRYFNPIGAHESGLIGEDPNEIPNNLVPYIAQVALGKREKLLVYGNDYPTHDGTGVRDYIHVMDLAEGHVAALKRLEKPCSYLVCNLGTGKGYSVLDVLHAYEIATNKTLPYEVVGRREGDIAVSFADPARARSELDWHAHRELDEMCASSWKWTQQNPKGYCGESYV